MMISEKSISKVESGLALPVMEAFHTLQGEGVYTGWAAWFLRLAGCDVGCVWCDVKESWEAGAHAVHPIEMLTEQALNSQAPICVVTGGEPTLYNLQPLTESLRNKGLRTHIETSGAHELTGDWHWICFSPKKFARPVDSIYKQADELKVVIYHPSDLKWAEDHARQVTDKCVLLLQPEWSKREKITPLIIDYIQKNPRWKLSLQTHKYVNIP